MELCEANEVFQINFVSDLQWVEVIFGTKAACHGNGRGFTEGYVLSSAQRGVVRFSAGGSKSIGQVEHLVARLSERVCRNWSVNTKSNGINTRVVNVFEYVVPSNF